MKTKPVKVFIFLFSTPDVLLSVLKILHLTGHGKILWLSSTFLISATSTVGQIILFGTLTQKLKKKSFWTMFIRLFHITDIKCHFLIDKNKQKHGDKLVANFWVCKFAEQLYKPQRARILDFFPDFWELIIQKITLFFYETSNFRFSIFQKFKRISVWKV
jgi:hypothetical protein